MKLVNNFTLFMEIYLYELHVSKVIISSQQYSFYVPYTYIHTLYTIYDLLNLSLQDIIYKKLPS